MTFIFSFIVLGLACFLSYALMDRRERNFQKNKQYMEAVYAGESSYQDADHHQTYKFLICKLHPDDKTPVQLDTACPKLIKEKYKIGDTIGVYYSPKTFFVKTAHSAEYPPAMRQHKFLLGLGYVFIFIAVVVAVLFAVKMSF
jgi:hypothetical protein